MTFLGLPAGLETLGYMLVGSVISSIVMFVFLLFIFVNTKGVLGPLLRAKLFGMNNLILLQKDKKLRFSAEKYSGGMIDTKDHGNFMVVPDSMYLSPHGVPTAIAYSDIGTTINPKFVKFTKLLGNGIEYTNEKGEKVVQKFENITELEKFNEEWKKKHKDSLIVQAGGETLVLQDILNYFKYNINPSFIQSKIENKLAQERLGEKKFPIHILPILFFVIRGLAITYMVISNYQRGQGFEDKWAVCTQNLAQCKGTQKVITGSGGQPVYADSGGTESPIGVS